MADTGQRRNTLVYALLLVFGGGGLLGIPATLLSLATDSEDLFAEWAVGDPRKIEQALGALSPPEQLTGNTFFAGFLWFLVFALATMCIMYSARSSEAASARASLATLNEQLAVQQKTAEELARKTELAAELQAQRDILAARPEGERAKIEYEAMISAARDAVRIMLGPEPKFRYTRVNETVTVERDGTTTVVRDYEVEAGTQPAKAGQFYLVADATAAKIDLLSNIDLRVQPVAPKIKGEAVPYLVTDNSSRRKEIAVFFHPPIEPGQSRRFLISYRWPGFAADLINNGQTTFFANYKTCDPSDCAAVVYRLSVAKSIGRVECEQSAPVPQSSQFDPDHAHDKWSWIFQAGQMPMHEARLEFEVRLVETNEPKLALNQNRFPEIA